MDGLVIVTFDEGGVSEHTNHVDTHFVAFPFFYLLSGQRKREEREPIVTNTVRIGGTEPVEYLRTFVEAISLELRTFGKVRSHPAASASVRRWIPMA